MGGGGGRLNYLYSQSILKIIIYVKSPVRYIYLKIKDNITMKIQ